MLNAFSFFILHFALLGSIVWRLLYHSPGTPPPGSAPWRLLRSIVRRLLYHSPGTPPPGSAPWRLLRSIVRRLLRDRYVVDVALAGAGRRDANQFCLALQRRDIA